MTGVTLHSHIRYVEIEARTCCPFAIDRENAFTPDSHQENELAPGADRKNAFTPDADLENYPTPDSDCLRI